MLLHTAGGFYDVTDNIRRYLKMGVYAVAAPNTFKKAFDYIGDTKNDFKVHWYKGAGHGHDILAVTPDSFGADALRRTDKFLRSFTTP